MREDKKCSSCKCIFFSSLDSENLKGGWKILFCLSFKNLTGNRKNKEKEKMKVHIVAMALIYIVGQV